eukprot:gene13612-biopygen11084
MVRKGNIEQVPWKWTIWTPGGGGLGSIKRELSVKTTPFWGLGKHGDPSFPWAIRLLIPAILRVSEHGETAEDASGTRPFLQILLCGTRPGRARSRFSQVTTFPEPGFTEPTPFPLCSLPWLFSPKSGVCGGRSEQHLE